MKQAFIRRKAGEPQADRKVSLVDRVVDDLGTAIVQGRYPEVSHLPVEATIAAELGVSRNVLREAIKLLSAKGLVRTDRGSGMTVLPRKEWNYLDPDLLGWSLSQPALSEDLVDELNTLRELVEPQVAAMAARVASTIEVLRLFEAYEMMENAPNKFAGVEADILFHRRMFEACHNKMLLSLMQTVAVVLRSNFSLAIDVDLVATQYPDDHLLVAEAIQRRDEDGARAVMATLLEKNRNNIAQMRAMPRIKR
ncbi:FadR/GntR family transcriptional regulator [Kaistia terrae]|uniref:FadR/GntR family transcriptional regulator n=1 Tax=Kaistia terrae TaxID=537017 RepID=A0ABW0Q2N0_9HYPH|nr:FadR/GntR family transcriptional regulator [Kaistia terrae]MCX5581542.1 FadR/GntR family transcriptional regulator [Kaistia terrae]